jgi:hypothetical protein
MKISSEKANIGDAKDGMLEPKITEELKTIVALPQSDI